MVTELRRTKLNESQVQTPTNHCTSIKNANAKSISRAEKHLR